MSELPELREAALATIRRFNTPENIPVLPLRWRLIIGDSESMDGIAPVCPSTGDTAGLHLIADYPDGPIQDETGVYDCCPTPWIEAGHGEIAAYLVALLNADAARAQEARAEHLSQLADCPSSSHEGKHCMHYQEGDGACCDCGRPNWCTDGEDGLNV